MQSRFLKTIPMKLYVLLAAVVIFAFFSNDFGLVDIQKTAIILAVGIDRAGDGYSLTTQIAVPKGSDRTTGGTSSVEIETKGATVSDCLTELEAVTGWVPKLVFCNLVVLGEDAAKEDAFAALNYFLRNEYMPDSCLIAACEGKAGELISSQSAIDDASSLAITKLFSDASVKSGATLPNSLKDFAIDHYGASESGYLPYLRAIRQEGEQQAAGGSQGGGGGEQTPQNIYTAQETALFSKGKLVDVLPPEQTFALSLLQGNVFSGTFSAEEKGEPVTLTVLEDDGGASLSMDGGPSVKLSLRVKVRLCCRGLAAPIEDVASDVVPQEVLESAERVLSESVGALFERSRAAGCDVFFLRRSLYRSSLRRYAEWKDDLLPAIVPHIETKVVSMH